MNVLIINIAEIVKGTAYILIHDKRSADTHRGRYTGTCIVIQIRISLYRHTKTSVHKFNVVRIQIQTLHRHTQVCRDTDILQIHIQALYRCTQLCTDKDKVIQI